VSTSLQRLKVEGGVIANTMKLPWKPFQSYGASLAAWNHAVLPATPHRWTRPP